MQPAIARQLDPTIQAQIYRWAYRLLQDHHDALDATQDVLVKYVRHADTDITNRRAWLRSTTVNHCIDLVRRRRPTAQKDLEPVDPAAPAATADQHELQHRITTALARLSERQRAVLLAKIYDGDTFATIAASMGISPSAVKTHYLRALRAMRDQLKGFQED